MHTILTPRVRLTCAILLTAALAANSPAGQSTQQNARQVITTEDAKKRLDKAAGDLDKVQKYLEEWGHGGFSNLVFLPQPDEGDGLFNPDNAQAYSTYHTAVSGNTQGQAVTTDFKGTALGVGASNKEPAPSSGEVDNDLTEAAASLKGAAKDFRESLAGPAGNPKTTISPVDAIKISTSTKVTELLLSLLANPKGLPKNSKVIFAAGTVSVSPGWRTQRDYAYEVTANAEYLDANNNRIQPEPGRVSTPQPSILAAFPMAEAQTMDLGHSQRTQLDLLFKLAGTYSAGGNNAAANALVRYLKRHEYDIVTRTPLPVVAPVSDGFSICYRIDPSVQALDDPAKRNSTPSRRLNMIAVPVLFAIICQASDWEKYEHIRINTYANWNLLEKRHWAKVPVDFIRYGHLRGTREKADKRLEQARALDGFYDSIGWLKSEPVWDRGCLAAENVFRVEMRDMKVRYSDMEARIAAKWFDTEIPRPPVSIRHVFHNIRPKNAGASLKVEGGGFMRGARNMITAVSVNGVRTSAPVIHSSSLLEVSLSGPVVRDYQNSGKPLTVTLYGPYGREAETTTCPKKETEETAAPSPVFSAILPASAAKGSGETVVILKGANLRSFFPGNKQSVADVTVLLGKKTTKSTLVFHSDGLARLTLNAGLLEQAAGKYDLVLHDEKLAADVPGGFTITEPAAAGAGAQSGQSSGAPTPGSANDPVPAQTTPPENTPAPTPPPAQTPAAPAAPTAAPETPGATAATSVSRISPGAGTFDRETEFLLLGDHFCTPDGRCLVTKALAGGRECKVTPVNARSLIVTVPPWQGLDYENLRARHYLADIDLELSGGGRRIFAGWVRFGASAEPAPRLQAMEAREAHLLATAARGAEPAEQPGEPASILLPEPPLPTRPEEP